LSSSSKRASAAPAPIGLRVLAATGVLLLAGVALQPIWMAPLVARELSERAGRSVHFDRMWIGLTTSLEPVLQLRGVRIDNAPWADSRRPFAALAAAAAVISWRSLVQQRPVIALMVLRDGEVDLERRADGLRNWRLSHPDDRGPGRYQVCSLQAERASLRFRHEAADLDLRANARPIAAAGTAAGPAAPPAARIEIEGEWRRLSFKIVGTTEAVLTFLGTGRSFALRATVEAGGARLDIDGRAGDIVREPIFDARVALVAPSLAPFAAFIESPRDEAVAVRVAGTVKAAAGSYTLAVDEARVGSTELAGELGWARGAPRSAVRARLESSAAELRDLRWLATLRAVAARAAVPAAVASAAAEAASGPLRARSVDAELSLVARRLHASELPWLESARLDASLTDGQLSVARFDVGIAKGHATGRARVDARERPSRAELELTLHGARLERLLHEAGDKGPLSGTLHGRAELKASGDSVAALLAGATGTVDASLVGGTISSLLDAEIGLQGGRIVRSMLGGAQPLAIRCAVAVVDLTQGAGQVRTLVFDTDRTRTVGRGAIDLAHGTIDVVLTPEAKQPGLLILDRSIRLHGPLRQPARELVTRVARPAEAARACPAARP
jgi:AsmA family protein